ncbi:Organic cation/carnitine transporter4 isoform 3 [Hibiscus syriacus]|uniref:Organic cation/carnitine transporter4 isoform 3 n=1 Tax=Hibiscus syriacus TaxID=106335 RepID=A0A6A3D2E8_HIBSY|nr:Organic cation/carnitine transporter4 isoform 3 [Hibiscus syriacus]
MAIATLCFNEPSMGVGSFTHHGYDICRPGTCLAVRKRVRSGCDEKVTSVCGLEPGSWEWEGGSESSTVAQWGCMSIWSFIRLGPGKKRFLTGFSTGGVGLCSFELATEPVGPTKRSAAGMTTFCFFPTGIAYSPQWYLVRGEMNEAMKIMQAIANSNGNNLPEGAILALDDEVNDTPNDNCFKEESGPVVDVIRSPVFDYSVLLNAVAEMLAFIITAVLLDRFGRKPLPVGAQWVSAIFCLTGCLVGNVGIWKVIKLCCGVLGIFGMAATYNLLFIYTAELLPTVVRNTALGSATQAAQMGAILSPLVVVLGRVLPFLVFGLCGLFGGKVKETMD